MTHQLSVLVSRKRSVAALLICSFCLGAAPTTALAGGGKTSSSTTTTPEDPYKATGRKNG
jgi:hypothetical protein